MEVPRLGVKLEPQMHAYATATASPDPEPHLQALPRCQILNLLSEATDQTRILMDTSWVLNALSHSRSSSGLTSHGHRLFFFLICYTV